MLNDAQTETAAVDTMVGLLRQQQHVAWQRGEWVSLERLIETHTDSNSLTDDQLLELLLSEHLLRRNLGVAGSVEEYARRFPALQQRLVGLFSLASEFEQPGRESLDPATQCDLTISKFRTRYLEKTTPVQPSPTTLQIGSTLGKYRLESRLGQGGMGAVYRAAHTMIRHHVALKVMLPHLIDSDELKIRFLNEANLCVALQHPNLVRTHTLDQEGNCLYLTMELLSGTNLAEYIQTNGPVCQEDAANIIRQAAQGLAYAHDKGIIHRDIKPQNIMRLPDGAIKILDLGLARLRDEYTEWQGAFAIDVSSQPIAKHLSGILGELSPNDRLTTTGAVMGTVAYMAPEQAHHPRSADARSDIYSLGCTAYYLLTGQSIYGEMSVVDVLKTKLFSQHWHSPSIDQLHPGWRELIRRMVAWDPRDRFSSMDEVMQEIDRLMSKGDVWLPESHDLETLKAKLLHYGLVTEKFWRAAFDQALTHEKDYLTMSSSFMPMSPTAAFDILFQMSRPLRGHSSSLLTQFQVQQILAGHIAALRYEDHIVLDFLNHGWKGQVLHCRRISTGRIEVLRTLPLKSLRGLGATEAEQLASLPTAVDRLVRMNAPLVGRIYEARLSGETVLLFAEYIPGAMLGKEVRRKGGLRSEADFEIVLSSALDMARSVSSLHAHGVLHLDLSSERWVRTPQGQLRLLDPGIAGLLLPREWNDIPSSAGMPPVIAPEMYGDLQAVSPACDVYALGQVFKFLRTGDFPFKSMKLSELPMRKRSEPSASADIWRTLSAPPTVLVSGATASREKPRWDVEFDRLIEAMTEVNVSARLSDVELVIDRLQQILQIANQNKKPPSEPRGLVSRLAKKLKNITRMTNRSGGEVDPGP